MEKRVVFRNNVLPYLLVAPQIIVTLVFFVWPATQTLVQSFFAGGRLRDYLNGSALPGWAGKKVILGIRPEHLQLDSKGPRTILFTVGQVELLGADTLVHGHIGAKKVTLTVRLPDVHRFEKQAAIRLSVSQGKLHLFDPETKKRIDG